MKLKTHLFFAFAFWAIFSSAIFGQWAKLNLPALPGTIHMGYSGGAFGKNGLWLSHHDFAGDLSSDYPAEFLRTDDGGQTFTRGPVLPSADDYWYHLDPYDGQRAFLLTSFQFSEPFSILETKNGGASWAPMAFTPPTFPNLIHFFDPMNGVFNGDPDSLGGYFAYTTDGGNSFTRISTADYPPMIGPDEFFLGGGYKVVGDAVFLPSQDFSTGKIRHWRTIDKGRTWTTGQQFETNSPFGDIFSFTDANNGLLFVDDPNPNILFTEDGGNSWQLAGPAPGVVNGGLDVLPGTNNIVGIFQDPVDQVLFSAATNDLGRSWHSRRDLGPYTLDTIYAQSGIPPFVWTNLEMVDNHTAWAKFSRTDMYRYDNAQPIISEAPDLELSLSSDAEELDLWGSQKFTLTIRNRGLSKATGIRAHWLPPYNRTSGAGGPFAFQAAYASAGHFDEWNGDWDLTELGPGQTATATMHLFVLQNLQNVDQSAQITACDQLDLDSAPNNMTATSSEDDEAKFVSLKPIAPDPSSDDRANANTAGLFRFDAGPNPASESIFIQFDFEEMTSATLELIDPMGRILWSKRLENAQIGSEIISVAALPQGIYVVSLEPEGKKTGQRKRILLD